MESQPTSTPGGIYCSACGHLNASWRLECEKCKTKLVSPDRPAYPSSHERPGCVTAYAVLLGISAGLIAIAGLIFGVGMLGDELVVLGLLFIVVAVVIAALYFLLARGLWQLKNWARIIIIVLQGIGLLGSLLQLLLALSAYSLSSYGFGTDATTLICGAVVGLAIEGYIIYWFASNGEYFS